MGTEITVRTARDRVQWAAALLNASATGAGYLYQRRWRAFVVYWVGVAAWWFLASPTGVWLAIIVAWVLLAVWRAAAPAPHADPPRPAPGHPVALAVGAVLLVATAAGVVTFRSQASDALRAADAAHAEGDCEAAIERYDRVTGTYRLAFSGRVDEADQGRQACVQLEWARETSREASEHDDDEHLDGTVSSYEEYLETPGRRFTDGARAELATVLDRQATALAGRGDPEGWRDAYALYVRLVDDHAGSPEAEATPDAVQAMWEGATAGFRERRWCDAIVALRAFGDLPGDDGLSDDVVAAAHRDLPVALLQCGLERSADDNLAGARTMLQEVVDGYPGTSGATRAQAELDDITRREEEARIRDEIAGVEPGADALPPPAAAGTAPAGTVTVEIVNGSPERLEILYTGPQTGSMTIDPCGDCATSSSIDNILLGSYCGTTSSPRRTITLAPGDYQVVAKAADGADVRPFSGTWALASGTAYSDCYYIQQSPF